MKKKYLFFTFSFFIFHFCFAQIPEWDWASQAGGHSFGHDESNCICTDNQGNVYISGEIDSDTCYFDSLFLVNCASTCTYNSLFVAKLNPNGNFIWANGIDVSSGVGYGICCDNFGNVYITGSVSGCFTFANVTYCGYWNKDIVI